MQIPLPLLPEGGDHTLLAVIEALPFALLALGPQGDILFINPAAEELIGASVRRVMGKKIAEVPYLAKALPLIARTRQTRGRVREHRLILEGGGKQVSVHATAQLYAGDDVLLLLEPFSQSEMRAEEEARERITAASSLMAAMLGHEIKNPLAGIRGAAQLLGMDAGEEGIMLSQLICAEVDRIRDMVERVEYLSGDIQAHAQPLNVHEALRYACTLAQKEKPRQELHIEEQFDPSLPMIMAERSALIQIFLNLLKNATEALMEHPAPMIGLKTHLCYDSAKYAVVEITDNGPGIPDVIRASLFEPFSSTHAGQGRGLGLAIAAHLVTGLGGMIEALPGGQGSGACFRVVLPLVRNV